MSEKLKHFLLEIPKHQKNKGNEAGHICILWQARLVEGKVAARKSQIYSFLS